MQTEKQQISHVPNGFTAVTPYFQVTEGEKFLKFLNKAFEVTSTDLHREDGRLMHFALKLYGAMIEGSEVSGSEFPARELAIHLYVPDADEVYAKAISAGGTSIYEVQDMPYGERSGGVTDPCGNSWYIATQKIDMYPDNG